MGNGEQTGCSDHEIASPMVEWEGREEREKKKGKKRALIQSAATQIVGNDDISYSIKDKLDVVGIGGTSDV